MATSAQIANYYQQQYGQVERVALATGVSPQTLWGVYGAESGYGTNEGPSSAGAAGPFQFLPSTGAKYGLTPTTITSFGPSLTAAAKYLKSLGANSDPRSSQTVAALNAYNGNKGGTTLTSYVTSVLQRGSVAPKSVLATVLGPNNPIAYKLDPIGDSLTNAIEAPFKAISSIADAISWVFSNWLRIFEFVGGVIMVVYGVILLGKVGMAEV